MSGRERNKLVLLLAVLGFAEVGATPPRGGPWGQKELPTTAADIYLSNLAGQVASVEERLARAAGDQDARVELSQLLHMRGKYRGDLDELQRALELMNTCVAQAPGDARLYALRGSQQLSLHRFARARDDLEQSRRLGGAATLGEELQQELDWSQGRHEGAEASIRRAAEQRPSVWTLARLARLEHDLGHQREADQAFARAEALITDTSPFTVAWLNLQRGHHKLVLGAYPQAESFLREAVRRMPGYVPALEHLAETLHLQGREAEALALYSQALGDRDESTSPEVLSGMATVLQAGGRKAEAERMVERATRRYGQLLQAYPEAMAWHAAEFFLGAGRDPAKAVELLKYNVELRPQGESWAALSEALLAQGARQEAKAALDKALDTPLRSPTVHQLAAKLQAAVPGAERCKPLEPKAVQQLLQQAWGEYKDLKEGKNADYIPALARVDPSLFGLALVTADGRVYEAGDSKYAFAIESVAKPFVLSLVMDELGAEAVARKVGVEATGMPFNSIIAIEQHAARTVNPLVNAGAIATTGLVGGESPAQRWSAIIGRLNAFAGRELTVNQEIYKSESQTNSRNQSIAALLKSYGLIQGDPAVALDLYTRECSVALTTRDLATMGATLANGGVNPLTGKQVLRPENVRGVLSVMMTAGLYDGSGGWSYRVGLPAKSGVGGGIIAVVPGRFGLAAFSPPLDEAGNSVRAQRAILFIASRLGANLFEPACPPVAGAR